MFPKIQKKKKKKKRKKNNNIGYGMCVYGD